MAKINFFFRFIPFFIFQKLFDISPCSQPWIDIIVDSLFEYSLLVNLLLIGTCVGCTRWVLVPWLILYAINILLLSVVAVYLFINPVPLFTAEHPHYELMRLFGLVPVGVIFILGEFEISVCQLGIHNVEIQKFFWNSDFTWNQF